MIHAWYRQDGNSHELSVYGHGGGEYGKDICCAGVSALTLALLKYLENHEEDIEDMDGPVAESGKMYIRCQGGTKITAVFRMTVLGLQQMADTYGSRVDLQIVTLGD